MLEKGPHFVRLWSSKLFGHMLRATPQTRLFLTLQLEALLCLQSLKLRRVGKQKKGMREGRGEGGRKKEREPLGRRNVEGEEMAGKQRGERENSKAVGKKATDKPFNSTDSNVCENQQNTFNKDQQNQSITSHPFQSTVCPEASFQPSSS